MAHITTDRNRLSFTSPKSRKSPTRSNLDYQIRRYIVAGHKEAVPIPNLGPLPAWAQTFESRLSPGYREFLTVLESATAVQNFSLLLVSGLLQTERYARAVMANVVSTPRLPSRIEEMLEVRMAYQWHKLEHSPDLKKDFIIDESVLYRLHGGPVVLREQLQHLLAASHQPNISLRIVPLSHPHTLFDAHFHLLKPHDPGADIIVHTEDMFRGGSISADPRIVEYYQEQWLLLRLHAYSADDSRTAIERAIHRLNEVTTKPPPPGPRP